MRWYKSTSFWSACIAACALILTQLPPVSDWLPKEKFETKISNRIGIVHAIGLLGFQLTLDLKNSGNTKLNLSDIRLELEYPTPDKLKVYKADSYLKILASTQPPVNIPVTSINLDVGETWTESVLFYHEFSPTEEESINNIRLGIFQSIIEKGQNSMGGAFNPRALLEASPEVVAQAQELFNSRFDLEKGTYKAKIRYKSNESNRLAKSFNFTIYDYQIEMIKSQTDDYKFGAGIYIPIAGAKSVWARVTDVK